MSDGEPRPSHNIRHQQCPHRIVPEGNGLRVAADHDPTRGHSKDQHLPDMTRWSLYPERSRSLHTTSRHRQGLPLNQGSGPARRHSPSSSLSARNICSSSRSALSSSGIGPVTATGQPARAPPQYPCYLEGDSRWQDARPPDSPRRDLAWSTRGFDGTVWTHSQACSTPAGPKLKCRTIHVKVAPAA